ncbi:MAG: NUDIX hydrolase [Patescibacteria group bacterium]
MNTKNYTIVECAGGIVKNKNRIALIKMKNVPGWGFPKGGIDNDEIPLDTARREILEETGIKDVSFIKELEIYQRPAADGQPKLLNIKMFIFETDQEEISPIENDVIDAQWFSINEVLNVLSLEDDKKFFLSIINII